MSRGFVVKGGKSLPELIRPARAGEIWSGYQAISQEGEVLTGTLSGTMVTKVKVKINNKHYNDDICVTETSSTTTIRNGGSTTLSLYRGCVYAVEYCSFNGPPSVMVVSGSCSKGRLGHNADYFIPNGDCEIKVE